jgi:hypothetical protein
VLCRWQTLFTPPLWTSVMVLSWKGLRAFLRLGAACVGPPWDICVLGGVRPLLRVSVSSLPRRERGRQGLVLLALAAII